MRFRYVISIVLLTSLVSSAAAQDNRPTFMRHAQIEHRAGGNATITVNDPRPLWRAIYDLREEYGWSVSYEDAPITNPSELVDYTAPSWRAEHPTEKSYMIPRGRLFSSTFSEVNVSRGPDGAGRILRSLVADYNRVGPGKYEIRTDGPDNYVVVPKYANNASGKEQSVEPIFDTPVFLPAGTRTALEILDQLLEELSRTSGVKVAVMWAPDPILAQTQVTLGGTREPARVWLDRIFAATSRPIIWDLLFEPNHVEYHMNVYIATKAVPQKNGQRWLVPIDRIEKNNNNRP